MRYKHHLPVEEVADLEVKVTIYRDLTQGKYKLNDKEIKLDSHSAVLDYLDYMKSQIKDNLQNMNLVLSNDPDPYNTLTQQINRHNSLMNSIDYLIFDHNTNEPFNEITSTQHKETYIRARNKLITNWLPLIKKRSFNNELSDSYNNFGFAQLIAVNCADRYSILKWGSYSTFIKKSINFDLYFPNVEKGIIHVPASAIRLNIKIRKLIDKGCSDEEVADELNINLKRLNELRNCSKLYDLLPIDTEHNEGESISDELRFDKLHISLKRINKLREFPKCYDSHSTDTEYNDESIFEIKGDGGLIHKREQQNKELRMILNELIDELPTDEKNAFETYNSSEEISLREMGEKEGVSKQTILNWIQNAGEKLRTKLKRYNIGEDILNLIR